MGLTEVTRRNTCVTGPLEAYAHGMRYRHRSVQAAVRLVAVVSDEFGRWIVFHDCGVPNGSAVPSGPATSTKCRIMYSLNTRSALLFA